MQKYFNVGLFFLISFQQSYGASNETFSGSFLDACASGRYDAVKKSLQDDKERVAPDIYQKWINEQIWGSLGNPLRAAYYCMPRTKSGKYTQQQRDERERHKKIIQLLLASGADPNITPLGSRPLLTMACNREDEEMVDLLLAYKANTEAIDGYQDQAFTWVAKSGNCSIAQKLIDAKANINARSGNKGTPLFYAVREENISMAQLLIQAGADVNLPYYGGSTPMHEAASKGLYEIMQQLKEHGAKVDARCNCNETPLMEAAKNGDLRAISDLVTWGADLNAKNRGGHTVLSLAVSYRKKIAVALLLKLGAKDIRAFGIACTRGYDEIAELLKNHASKES
jgi:ankyrin repeat protein